MFSRRTPRSFDLNPLSRALEKISRQHLLDLTPSNPARVGLAAPEEILKAFLDPRILSYEPDPHGMPEARKLVMHHLGQRGLVTDPERIFLTASTSEAYSYLFKLLCDPGDSVLVPEPSYPLLDHLIELECVTRLPYRLVYEKQWKVDFESIRDALESDEGERVRAIVVVSPNNPTGSYLKTDELEQLVKIAAEKDLAIISDEVFWDYRLSDNKVDSPAPVYPTAHEKRVLTFSLGGLSKTLGLPQMKLGWIVVNGPEPHLSQCLEKLELIADTYLSVGTPVQAALGKLLEQETALQEPIKLRIRRNLAAIREAVRADPSVELLTAEGGWYAMLKVPKYEDDETLAIELLEKDHVLIQPGYFYDCTDGAHLVISLLTPEETLKQGLEKVLKRLSKLREG